MTDKNMVDVADKAVEKIAGGIESVARAVEKVAPHVWEVLVRQALYEGAVYLIGSCLAMLFAAWCARGLWRQREWIVRHDLEPPVTIVACPALFLVACLSICQAADAALHLANPQYYAAKQLIEAAK